MRNSRDVACAGAEAMEKKVGGWSSTIIWTYWPGVVYWPTSSLPRRSRVSTREVGVSSRMEDTGAAT